MLDQIGKHDLAAELYESIDKIPEALECLMRARSWDRAKQLCQQRLPNALAMVEEKHRASLIESGQTDELAARGDVSHALDALARAGDWGKCLALAEKSAPTQLSHYLMQNVKSLVSNRQFVDSCRLLLRYGTPQDESAFAVYRVVAAHMTAAADTPTADLQVLRDVLLLVLSGGNSQAPPASPENLLGGDSGRQELTRYLLAGHLLWMNSLNKERQLGKWISAKACISLCRYCDCMAVDRVFYNAGLECKDLDQKSLAFFYLNRYLDLVDAIQDPDNSTIDDSDFEGTDIPSPFDINMPEALFGSEALVEEARDWVLGWSVDASVESDMQTRSCDKCQSQMYVAGLQCKQCNMKYPPCVVTGYPVLRSTRVECSNCCSAANKEDWNSYVQNFKTCPWCKSPQNPIY